MKIQGHSVVITGAGSGMGAETARFLASKGAKVTLMDIQPEAIESLAKELDGVAVVCDITDEKSIRDGFLVAENKNGATRVCINCAGILHGGRVVGKEGPFPLDLYKKVIDVNLVGTFNVMRLAAEAMLRHEPIEKGGERGVIINTASIAAFEGQIGQAAYSASKGGVVAMTLPVARELARFGIRVMTIAPGLIATPMMEGLPLEFQQNLAQQVTFPKRLGKPSEYASLAAHIIENEYLNGEVIRLDGGIRMQEK